MYAEFARGVAALQLDRCEGRWIVKASAGALRSMREAGNVPRGIQACARFVHHAAEINVRADFAAQFAFRNDTQFVIEFALDERGGFFVAIEVGLLTANFHLATARQVTVDIL